MKSWTWGPAVCTWIHEENQGKNKTKNCFSPLFSLFFKLKTRQLFRARREEQIPLNESSGDLNLTDFVIFFIFVFKQNVLFSPPKSMKILTFLLPFEKQALKPFSIARSRDLLSTRGTKSSVRFNLTDLVKRQVCDVFVFTSNKYENP